MGLDRCAHSCHPIVSIGIEPVRDERHASTAGSWNGESDNKDTQEPQYFADAHKRILFGGRFELKVEFDAREL